MDLIDQFAAIFADFANPKKRVFVGYLALAAGIALLWLILVRKRSLAASLAEFFDRRIFFSGSSVADYKIFVVNRLVTGFVSPLLVTQIAIATAIYFWLHSLDLIHAGYFRGVDVWIVVALFSAVMFVVDDFSKYLVHRWMHKWPVLWAIHKTHHSATTLTPVTVYRVHPLEGVLYASRSAAAQGATMSAFVFLFGDAVDLYTVVGVNVLVFIFHVTGSNLRHSHVHIGYWPWLERILISPAQHQLHHSIAEEHYDKNFGAALAVWDWLFGSLHLSEPGRALDYGLEEGENAETTRLAAIYAQPFIEIGAIAGRRLSALKSFAPLRGPAPERRADPRPDDQNSRLI